MFDITSFVREKIFRRPSLTQVRAGEELSEKQTTKMGYLLLICMFFAIISTAQWSLSIISDIPEKPTAVPNCVERMLTFFDDKNEYYDSYYYDGYNYHNTRGYNDCNLTSTYPKYNFTDSYNALLLGYNEASADAQSLSQARSDLSRLEADERNIEGRYNTSLTEDIADSQNRVYNSENVSGNLQNIQSQIQSKNTEISRLTANINRIKAQYQPQISKLKNERNIAYEAYKKSYLLYRLFIAVLSLLFSGLVFAVLYKFYVRYKIENSPHTVIFSVATFAYGIILLQVLLLFLWDIIPHKIFEILLGWISLFTPLLFVVQFLWPVIIIAIFGFLVYRIQKRLYSPQNIVKRFVMDKKCPNCGNAVDMKKPFCPLCAHEIHIHCPHCHELTMKGMPYCSNCGGNLPKENEIYTSHAHTLQDDIQKELDQKSLDAYSAAEFILLDGSNFVSKRETIIKLALYITEKIGKTEFAPGEFAPYLEKILDKVDRKGISQAELDRVLGKIRTWTEIGGKVQFIKK